MNNTLIRKIQNVLFSWQWTYLDGRGKEVTRPPAIQYLDASKYYWHIIQFDA